MGSSVGPTNVEGRANADAGALGNAEELGDAEELDVASGVVVGAVSTVLVGATDGSVARGDGKRATEEAAKGAARAGR